LANSGAGVTAGKVPGDISTCAKRNSPAIPRDGRGERQIAASKTSGSVAAAGDVVWATLSGSILRAAANVNRPAPPMIAAQPDNNDSRSRLDFVMTVLLFGGIADGSVGG
jgi:hypothetical protein